MNKLNDFWKSKQVCVLGGAGFIGSHLTESLLNVAKSVIVVDDFSAGLYKNIPKDAYIYQADLRNFSSCVHAMKGSDIIFHLASDNGGRGYFTNHNARMWGNLELDTTIFRACEQVEKVVFFSSACAVGEIDGVYGLEKSLGEQMLKDFSIENSFSGISVRPYTVYGPRMKENRAIGALIAKTFIQQDPFEVWGDGNQKIDWIYVKDLVEGVLLAAEKMDDGEVDIGSGKLYTPMDALDVIWYYVGWSPKKIVFRSDMPIGPIKIADTTKIHSLGWERNFSFDQGVQNTVDWYYRTHAVEDVRENFERKLLER